MFDTYQVMQLDRAAARVLCVGRELAVVAMQRNTSYWAEAVAFGVVTDDIYAYTMSREQAVLWQLRRAELVTEEDKI